ncbi:MAG: hypothetical protein K9G76_02075 [Bacteroidales bacterium]|nr:hypothetical protein [Bacteroidales bacterium]MCF8405671.1 hypothetical protein [Bacteroidales bacterium]
MQVKSVLSVFTLIVIMSSLSCKSHIKSAEEPAKNEAPAKTAKAGPAVIIYKTSGKYFNNVPVSLSADKKSVVSFPGPKDIYYKGEFSYPSLLENGYFLDNRGIDENTAFLKITYEEYSKFEKAPTSDEIMEMVLDNNPFTEMYHCGSRFDYKNLESELNDIITNGRLDAMKRLR